MHCRPKYLVLKKLEGTWSNTYLQFRQHQGPTCSEEEKSLQFEKAIKVNKIQMFAVPSVFSPIRQEDSLIYSFNEKNRMLKLMRVGETEKLEINPLKTQEELEDFIDP